MFRPAYNKNKLRNKNKILETEFLFNIYSWKRLKQNKVNLQNDHFVFSH